MGKAKRLHRDAVRSGLEKPYRSKAMTDAQWDTYKMEHSITPYDSIPTEPQPNTPESPEANPLEEVQNLLKRMGIQ